MASSGSSNYAYCQLWDLIPQAALLYTPEGQLLDCNQNSLALYGYTREDLLTRKFLQLTAFADQARVEAQQAQGLLGEAYSLEVHHLKQNGESFPVQIKIQWLQMDDQTLLLALVEDRTLWQQTHHRLANLEAAMRQLSDNKVDPLCLLDHDLKCVYINAAFETTFGYDFKHSYALDINHFFHPDELETFHLLFKMAQLERIPLELTTRFKHHMGHYIWAEISAIPLWSEQDHLVGFSISLRDITLYVQALEEEDKQRKQAQTLANAALALTTHLEVDKVLREILIQAHHLVPYKSANIALLEGDHLRISSQYGYVSPSLADFAQPLEECKLDKQAIDTRQAVIVADTQLEPRWILVSGTEWIRAYLVLPLYNVERVLGCLRLDSDEVGSFDADTVSILQPLANVAAVALEKALLHQHLTQELELRRRNEEHLRLLEAAIYHAKDAIAITGGLVTSEGPTLELINPAFTLLTGYDSSQLIGKNVASLMDLSFNQAVLDALIQNLNQGQPFEGRLKAANKNGDPLHLTWTTAPIQNAEDEITHFITILHDVTAQELQTQAIEDMRQMLRSTLDSLGTHIAVLNPKGEIILVNEAWRTFAQGNGAPPNEDYLGHNYLAVCENASGRDAALATMVSSAIRAMIAGEQDDFLQEYQLTDGLHPTWFLMRITPFDEPAPRRVVVAHTSITERVLAEKAAEASRDELTSVLNSIDDVIISVNLPDHRLIHVSSSFEKVMGYPPEAFMRNPQFVAQILHPDDRDLMIQQYQNALLQPFKQLEHRIILPTGEIRWVRRRIWVKYDAEGKPTRVDELIADITEFRQAQEAVHRQNTILQQSREFIGMTDLAGNVLYINQGGIDMIGYDSPEAIKGTHFRDYHTPEDTEQMQAVWLQAAAQMGQWHGESRLKTRTGELIDVSQSIFPIMDERGNIQYYATIMSDIRERKRAENALRTSEEKYRRLVEGTDSVICLVDAEGTYLFVNEIAARNMNSTPEALTGKRIHDIFPPEEANFQLADIRRVIQTQTGEIFENPITVGGEIRWYNSSVQPIRDGSGQVVYALINARDVTSRKKLELNLEQMIQRLKVLHSIDLAILHARSVDEVAQKASVHLQELIGCKRVSFIHFETDSTMGHVRAVAPLSEETLELGRWLVYSSFYLNRLRNHEVIVVNHPNEMPFQSALGKAWRREGLGSSIQIPLVNDGTLFSLFSLEDTNPYFFNQGHVDMVQEIANAVAVAMRQNQLKQAVQKYTLELEQRVEARTQELNHAKERVEAILDSSGDGIILVDLQRGIQQTNPAFDTLFEASQDHYFGASLISLITPDSLPVLQASIQQVVESKEMERVELQAQSSTGQVFDINLGISPIVIAGEPVTALVCSLQDITQRKQIERQLRYHASLQETVTDAVVVTDTEFRVQSWNRAAERLYGRQAAEAIGKPVSDLFKSEFMDGQNGENAILKLYEQGYWTGEVRQTCHDGSRLTVLSSVVLLKDETGFPYGVVAVNHDITARKQSEETLKLALAKEKELGELKSRFVSMASHEFRTPLATILATADTLDAYRHRMDETDITRRLGKIRQQVMNLKGIIDDVLTLSRIQAGQADFKPTMTNMQAFLEDILDEFQTRPDVSHQFEVQLPNQPLEASVDQKLMRQVISNLIANALKYSAPGSLVSVKLEPAEETFIFSIKDEGIGIPNEDRDRLFQAFHRATNVGTISGTGLGLSIIREAIELHHGTIQLDSQVGAGSLFKVTVPLKQNFQGESDDSATHN